MDGGRGHPGEHPSIYEGAAARGFSVQLVVPHSRPTLRWEGISLDATFIDMRRCGRLFGPGGLRQGLVLSLSPSGLARYE